jgi:hypothetical protein
MTSGRVLARSCDHTSSFAEVAGEECGERTRIALLLAVTIAKFLADGADGALCKAVQGGER